MDGGHGRRLSSWLVGGVLVLGLVSLVVGLLAAAQRPIPPDAPPLPLTDLPERLADGQPLAWVSLGFVLLLLTPLVRVGGMLTAFWREGERRSLLSAVGLAVLLSAALVLGFMGYGLRG